MAKKSPQPGSSRGMSKMHAVDQHEQAIERAIGARLRALYDEVAQEPVPDRFVELLKQLDDKKPKG
jgi:hypothetical protein